MPFDFSNKHVVITGGTGALGSAVTSALLEAGARCSIPLHSSTTGDNFELADHSNCLVVTGVDLSDEDDARQFYADAVSGS